MCLHCLVIGFAQYQSLKSVHPVLLLSNRHLKNLWDLAPNEPLQGVVQWELQPMFGSVCQGHQGRDVYWLLSPAGVLVSMPHHMMWRVSHCWPLNLCVLRTLTGLKSQCRGVLVLQQQMAALKAFLCFTLGRALVSTACLSIYTEIQIYL
jgi:hypothetical protein